MPVVVVDVVLDFSSKFFDTLERSTPDRFLRDNVEPDFDLVQPGGVGWSIVDVPSFMGSEPTLDSRMLVCGIVVNHDVHIELLRDVLLDMLQERQVFLMPVVCACTESAPSPWRCPAQQKGLWCRVAHSRE